MSVKYVDGKYVAEFQVKGKRFKRRFDHEDEALVWERTTKENVLNGTYTEGSLEVGKYTLEYLLENVYEQQWKNSGSAKKNRYIIEELYEYFGKDRRVETITQLDIDQLRVKLRNRGLAGSTINKRINVLSLSLRKAYEWELTRRNFKIKRERTADIVPKYLTIEEEVVFLATLKAWSQDEVLRTFIVLMDTGYRPSHLFRLKVSDIDFGHNVLIAERAGNSIKKARTLPLTKRCREELQRQVKGKSESDLLFPDGYWNYEYMWTKVREHLGWTTETHEQHTPYITRHTCATRLLMRGATLKEVQEWLGHKSIQTTMRYAHLIKTDSDAKMVSILEGFANE